MLVITGVVMCEKTMRMCEDEQRVKFSASLTDLKNMKRAIAKGKWIAEASVQVSMPQHVLTWHG